MAMIARSGGQPAALSSSTTEHTSSRERLVRGVVQRGGQSGGGACETVSRREDLWAAQHGQRRQERGGPKSVVLKRFSQSRLDLRGAHPNGGGISFVFAFHADR